MDWQYENGRKATRWKDWYRIDREGISVLDGKATRMGRQAKEDLSVLPYNKDPPL